MDNSLNHDLGKQAAQHHGVFSREEARRLGVSDTASTDRNAQGRYRSVGPGVYAIVGAPETLQQRMAAAVLSFPSLAAVSHTTAAELWGMTSRGIRSIEVVTTRWDRVRRRDVVVHESLDLIECDATEVDGIAVTTPERTVVDLGASNSGWSRRLSRRGFERACSGSIRLKR